MKKNEFNNGIVTDNSETCLRNKIVALQEENRSLRDKAIDLYKENFSRREDQIETTRQLNICLNELNAFRKLNPGLTNFIQKDYTRGNLKVIHTH